MEVNCSPASHTGVRDSKLGTATPVLVGPAAQWARVIAAIQDGTPRSEGPIPMIGCASLTVNWPAVGEDPPLPALGRSAEGAAAAGT
jgi:hypothetical protein